MKIDLSVREIYILMYMSREHRDKEEFLNNEKIVNFHEEIKHIIFKFNQACADLCGCVPTGPDDGPCPFHQRLDRETILYKKYLGDQWEKNLDSELK